METREIDRWLRTIQLAKQTLVEVGSNPPPTIAIDVEKLRHDLVAAENAFATESPGAWVAIVCSDYKWPDENGDEVLPSKNLVPVSRFRGIESTTCSYALGNIRFRIWKHGSQIRGVILDAEYTNDWPNRSDNEPIHQAISLGGTYHGASSIYMSVHTSHEEALLWFSDKPGRFPFEVLQEDHERIKRNLATSSN